MKNKANVEKKRALKKVLMDNKSRIPDIKILMSASNRRKGQAIINAITSRYGNEEVRYIQVEKDESMAYTNGRIIVVNMTNPLFGGDTLSKKRVIEQGLYSHESGHILFTDFESYQEIMKSWYEAKRIIFPVQQFPYYDDKMFVEMNTCFSQCPDAFIEIIHFIMNAFEDAYIEDKVKKICKGSVKTSIEETAKKLCKLKLKDIDKADYSDYVLMVARDCLPKKIYNDYPVYEKIKKLNAANLNGFCTFEERFGRSLSAVFLLWEDYIKPEIEKAILDQKLKELLNKFVQKNQSQNNQSSNQVRNNKQMNGMASKQVCNNQQSQQGQQNQQGQQGQQTSNKNSSSSQQSQQSKLSQTGNAQSKSEYSNQEKNDKSSSASSSKLNEQKTDENGSNGEDESTGKKDDASKENGSNGSNSSNNGEKDNGFSSEEKNGDENNQSDQNESSKNNGSDSQSSDGTNSIDESNSGFGDGFQRSLFDNDYMKNLDNAQQQNKSSNSDESQNAQKGKKEKSSKAEIGAKEDLGEGKVENVSEEEYFNSLKNSSDKLSESEKTDTGSFENETELISKALNELSSEDPDTVQSLVDDVDIKEITSNDLHRRVDCKVYHIKSGNKEKYSEIAEKEEIVKLSKNLQRKVKKDIFERRLGVVKHNLYSGKNLDLKAISNGSDKVFMKSNLPNKKPILCAGVMIDMSGSMGGNKIYKATVAAMLLEDFCRNMGIPLSIMGHSTSGSRVEIYDLFDFGERNTDARARLMNITSNNCNRDGFAIRYLAKQMMRRKEETKLLFVISDGLPNHNGYHSAELIADLADMKRKFKKDGIVIVPLCIDSGSLSSLKAIYGASLVDATDLKKFPVQLNSILVKELKRKFN